MVLAIEQMEHMIHLLQAQVLQLTSRVSTLDEALLAERRHNEQIATQLRAQVDASEGVLRQELARLRSEAAISLSAASPIRPTVAALGLRVDALKQLKETGVTAFTARELGYVLMEVRLAGYVEGLKQAGYSCAEMNQAGYTLAQIKAAGYTCVEMRREGWTLEQIRAAGYTCVEAKEASYSLAQLRAVGYELVEMREAGFTLAEMGAAGFYPDGV